MDGLTHCPGCNAILRVPRNACGHRVRCPACQAISVVPDEQALNDETISSWIEMDVDATLAQLDEKAARRFTQRQHAQEASGTLTAVRMQEAGDDLYDIRNDQPIGDEASAEAAAKVSDEPEIPAEKADDGQPVSPNDTARLNAITSDEPEATDEAASSYPTAKQPLPHHAGGRVSTDRPTLQVGGITSMGVRLTFDSRWLAWEGFRLSMPVQCVFSGETDRSKLIARPLVFPDKSLSRQASAQRLAAEHERRELKHQGPREWVKKMGTLELMPKPFNLIMPYYVSTKYAHLSLHCVTHDHRDDHVTCDVLIPHPPTALEWFARVNGVCGEDYLSLEHEVNLLHGDNWRNLSDTARQRILIWCKLAPGEQFRAYFNDADHGSMDEGLAGIVLTDKRLIYCKYHSKGKIPLQTNRATIHAEKEGKFVHLTLHLPEREASMVKLKMEDFEQLQSQVQANGTLAFKVRES